MSDKLDVLASILRASPAGNSLALVGQLLDSLPIGVLITDSSTELRCAYANESMMRLVPPDKFPIEGRPLGDVWERAQVNGVLLILQQVAASRQARHLRDFDYVGLAGNRMTLPGEVSVWDWEVYPLTDAAEVVTHLLIVILDATDRALVGPEVNEEQRRRLAEIRESASGIIRIFGGPDDDQLSTEPLTLREREVAELIADGLTNAEIAARIFRSQATVATHISRILQKLGFGSRAQIAVWAVRERLRDVLS